MVTPTVLIALGAFALVNVVKSWLNVRLFAPAKLLLVLGVCVGLAAMVSPDVPTSVLVAAGAFGLATLLHAAHKLLSAAGDHYRSLVLGAGRR